MDLVSDQVISGMTQNASAFKIERFLSSLLFGRRTSGNIPSAGGKETLGGDASSVTTLSDGPKAGEVRRTCEGNDGNA